MVNDWNPDGRGGFVDWGSLEEKAGSLEPPQAAGDGKETETLCPVPRTTWVSDLRKAAEAEFPLNLFEAWPMKASKMAAKWGELVH